MSFRPVLISLLTALAASLCPVPAAVGLRAAEAEYFSRPNGGFVGLFESDSGAQIALNRNQAVGGFAGQYAPGNGPVWKLSAGPGDKPETLKGEIRDGKRGLGFRARWENDVLIGWVDGAERRFYRTVTLLPALAETERSLSTLTLNRRWTIAVYMGADNDLEAEALADLREMRAGLPSENVDVIVLIDRAKGHSDAEGDWTGARLLRLRPDGRPDQVLKELGELDMSDPATLASFVTGAFKAFPAENYATILWDHGGGWGGVVLDEDIPGRPDAKGMLNLLDVRVGLRTAIRKTIRRPIDLIAFDACNMAQLEVALQVCDLGRYMTASEQTVPGEGYPYQRVLPLFGDKKLYPRDIAVRISEEYAANYAEKKEENTTLAALDLSQIPEVAAKLHTFSFLSEVFKESFWPGMKRALYYAESYGARSERLLDKTTPSLDLRDLVDRLTEGMKPIPLDKWAGELRAALDRAVLSSHNGDSRSRSHGLAVFAPRTAAQNAAHYPLLSPLGKNSDWLMLLGSVHAESAKHASDKVTISDLEFVSTVRDGKPVVRPFDGDLLKFKLAGASVIQVNQVDMRREGDLWVVLRRRWVPDPAWMARSKQGATDLADLFMPNFSDKENNLSVELTGQRFLVSNTEVSYNLTLDATNPDHGSPITAMAKVFRKGEARPILVEIGFDPVHWTAAYVLPLSDDPKVASRPIIPGADDTVSFFLETVDDDGKAGLIETEPMAWRRGPLLLFAADDPGKYCTILSAVTMDGRTFDDNAIYEVEENPDLASWIASYAEFDPANLRMDDSWYRNLVGPDGKLIETGAVSTVKELVGGIPGFFKVETALTLDGKAEKMTEYWLFRADPVPTLRIIQPVAGNADLCWYGPVSLGKEKDRRGWIAMKVQQMGGVMWKWQMSILDSLKLEPRKPKKPKVP